MAVTRTLTQMRQEVRDLADEPDTGFVTNAMIDRWLNLGLRKVYEMAYMADPEAYDLTLSTAITTAAGTAEYTLPTLFWKLIKMEVQHSGSYTRLERLHLHSMGNDLDERAAPRRYLLRGRTSVRLYPTPDGVYPTRVWYIPAFTVLTADGDTFDGINGWEEYGILDAAIKVRIKGESDSRELMALKAKIEQEIDERATERDVMGYTGIQDVKGDYDEVFGMFE